MIAAIITSLCLATYPSDGVIVWGQSNAVGYWVTPNSAITTTALGDNSYLTGNVHVADASTDWDVNRTDAWPPLALGEVNFESPRTALANKYYQITGRSLVVMTNARGGYNYTAQKSGTAQWAKLVTLLEAFGSRSPQPNRVVGALIVHGESDESLGVTRATYLSYLVELQADMQALVQRTTTNSPNPFPLYLVQTDVHTLYGHTTPVVALAQNDAAKLYPTKFKLIKTNYHETMADAVHVAAAAYVHMGARAAIAMAARNQDKRLWPVSITRTANAIRARFDVPSGTALALDTSVVSDPGNYGFEVEGGGSITSVTLEGADTVVVNVTGTTTYLDYAYTGISGHAAGPTQGARGCLRDSDTDSAAGYTYIPMFSEAIQ